MKFSHHDNHRPRGHVLQQTREERFPFQLLIVLREQIVWDLHKVAFHNAFIQCSDWLTKRVGLHVLYIKDKVYIYCTSNSSGILLPATSLSPLVWSPVVQSDAWYVPPDGVAPRLVSLQWGSSLSLLGSLQGRLFCIIYWPFTCTII